MTEHDTENCERCKVGRLKHNGGAKICRDCLRLQNSIIKRWLDGGDAPAFVIQNMLDLSRDALDRRISRIRRGEATL